MFDIVITNAPQFNYARPGSNLYAQRSLPGGIGSHPGRPPCKVEHRKRHYIQGQFARGLVFTEFGGLHPIGLTAPPAAVAVATAGGTMTAGNYIAYFELRHKVGTTVVHRSNLGVGSATFSLSGTQQVSWTIPATFADSRGTHVGLLLSRDGALPAEQAEVTVGTAALTSNNNILGYVPPVDPDGNIKQARGVPPYARYVTKYHRRAWYGGDPNNPSRWWYSELDEFESVGVLNYIDYLEGETVVGGGPAGDTLVGFGQSVHYAIQGWDEADFRIHRAGPAIGCISHFSIVSIDDILWFASEFGVYAYIPGVGARPLMAQDFLSEWRAEYAANEAIYEACEGADDRVSHVYKLRLAFPTNPRSRYWIGSYQHFNPSIGDMEGLPDWTFDRRDRLDSAMGTLRSEGSKRSVFYTGSCDGHIRKENVESNDDDDGDTLGKPLIFETPHYMPGEQAGDDNAGFDFNDLTMFLQSEPKSWVIEGRAGDDQAYLATVPDWTFPVPASQEVRGNQTRVAKTAHHFTPRGVSGKGAIFKVTIARARNARYRGLALGWTDGHQNRGLIAG